MKKTKVVQVLCHGGSTGLEVMKLLNGLDPCSVVVQYHSLAIDIWQKGKMNLMAKLIFCSSWIIVNSYGLQGSLLKDCKRGRFLQY